MMLQKKTLKNTMEISQRFLIIYIEYKLLVALVQNKILLHLISHQPDIDKIYLYVKDRKINMKQNINCSVMILRFFMSFYKSFKDLKAFIKTLMNTIQIKNIKS